MRRGAKERRGSGEGGGGTKGSTAGSCSGHGMTRSMSTERRPVVANVREGE